MERDFAFDFINQPEAEENPAPGELQEEVPLEAAMEATEEGGVYGDVAQQEGEGGAPVEEQYILDPTCDPNADLLRYINPATNESILIRHTDLKEYNGNLSLDVNGIAQPEGSVEKPAEEGEEVTQEAALGEIPMEEQDQGAFAELGEQPLQEDIGQADIGQEDIAQAFVTKTEAEEEPQEEEPNQEQPAISAGGEGEEDMLGAAGDMPAPVGEMEAENVAPAQDEEAEAAGMLIPSKVEQPEDEQELGGEMSQELAGEMSQELAGEMSQELAGEMAQEEPQPVVTSEAAATEAVPEAAGQEGMEEAVTYAGDGNVYVQQITNEDGTQSLVYYSTEAGDAAATQQQPGEVKYTYEQGAGDATQQMLITGAGLDTGGIQTTLVDQNSLQQVVDAGGSILQQVIAEGENGEQVMYYLVSDPNATENAAATTVVSSTGEGAGVITYDASGAVVTSGEAGTATTLYDTQAETTAVKSEVKQEWQQQAGTEQGDAAFQNVQGQQITTLYYDEQGNLVSSSTGGAEDPNAQGLLENYYTTGGQLTGDNTMVDADGNLVQVVYTLPDGTPIDESQLAGQNFVLTTDAQGQQVLTTAETTQSKFSKNVEMSEKISLGNGVTVTTVKPPVSGQGKLRGRSSGDGRSMIQYSGQDESGRKIVVLNPSGSSGTSSSGLRTALEGSEATYTTTQTPSGKTMVIMGSGDKWTTSSTSSSRYTPVARRGRPSRFESGSALSGKPNVKVITLKSLQQQQAAGGLTSTPISSRSQLNFKTFMNETTGQGLNVTDSSYMEYSFGSPQVPRQPVAQLVQFDENPEEAGTSEPVVPACPVKDAEEAAPEPKMPSFFDRIKAGMKRDQEARIAKRKLQGDDQVQSISLFDDTEKRRYFTKKVQPQIKRIKRESGVGRGRGIVIRSTADSKPGMSTPYKVGMPTKSEDTPGTSAAEDSQLSQDTTGLSSLADTTMDSTMDETTFDTTQDETSLMSSQDTTVGLSPSPVKKPGRGRGRGAATYGGRSQPIKTKTNIITITVPLKSSKAVGPILSATTTQPAKEAASETPESEREIEIKKKAAAAVQKALNTPKIKTMGDGKTPVYIRSGVIPRPSSMGPLAATKSTNRSSTPGFKVIKPAPGGGAGKGSSKVETTSSKVLKKPVKIQNVKDDEMEGEAESGEEKKDGKDESLNLECESFPVDYGLDDESEDKAVNPSKIEEAIAALIKATPRSGAIKKTGTSGTTSSIGRSALAGKSEDPSKSPVKIAARKVNPVYIKSKKPTPVGEPILNKTLPQPPPEALEKEDDEDLEDEDVDGGFDDDGEDLSPPSTPGDDVETSKVPKDTEEVQQKRILPAKPITSKSSPTIIKSKTVVSTSKTTVASTSKTSVASTSKTSVASTSKTSVSSGKSSKAPPASAKGVKSDSSQDSQSDKDSTAKKTAQKVLLVPSKASGPTKVSTIAQLTDDLDDEDEDLPCASCGNLESESPNEIVLCDECGQGYHQFCHDPEVTSAVLDLPEWLCRGCQDKKNATNQMIKAREPQFVPDRPVFDTKLFSWFPESLVSSNTADLKQGLLQCYGCHTWFHPDSTSVAPGPVMIGDYFFVYLCKECNNGEEYLKRLKPRWLDLAHLAMFHMSVLTNHKYFDINDEIIMWIKTNRKHLDLPASMMSEIDDESFTKKMTDILNSPAYLPRFKNGREVKRKVSLVGLRTRAAPTPPSCALPSFSQLTENNTKDWCWRITYPPFHPPSVDIASFIKSTQEGSTMKRSPEHKPFKPVSSKPVPAVAAAKSTPKATPKVTAKATPKDTPKATPKDTPKAMPKDTPKAMPKDTPKAMPKATPKVSHKKVKDDSDDDYDPEDDEPLSKSVTRSKRKAAEAVEDTPSVRSKRRRADDDEEEERPRVCPYCNKEFLSLKKLKQHEQAAHKKGNPLKCVCGEVFKLPYELSAHKRKECTKTI